MAAVTIRCPVTGQPVSTEIETEPSIFYSLPDVESRMICPACGQEHVWTCHDAWLDPPEPEAPPEKIDSST
jgi:predicted RNA-binding Zn-ribbon protein involved in translation (DUF1610 family)